MRFFVAAVIVAELGSTLALPTRLPAEVNALENTAFTRRNLDVAALLNSIGLGQANAGEQQKAAEAKPAKEEAVAAEGAQEGAAKVEEAALKEAEAAKAKEEAAAVEGEGKAAVVEGEAAAVAEGEAAAGAEGEAAAGEEGEAGEDLVGAFDVATELQGGDLKQDVLFTKSVSLFRYTILSTTDIIAGRWCVRIRVPKRYRRYPHRHREQDPRRASRRLRCHRAQLLQSRSRSKQRSWSHSRKDRLRFRPC
jgi:hypothetical protein